MTLCAFTTQAADFFQKAGQLSEKYGKLEWSHLKGLLQDKLVEQEVHRQTVAVRGKFLPLSVWEQKGFDTDRIKQNAEKQRSDIFDWVYRVPILEISHEKVTEEVRQRLLQAERKVGKRKASQQMEDEDVVDLEVDTKDWDSISSDDGAGGSKSKPRKACAPKAKSKTKKVPQEKKDEAKKANAVVLGNARKAIRLLDPVAKEAKKACKDVDCTDELKAETEGLLKVLKEATQITKKHSQATSEGKILEDISLTVQQVKELAAMVKGKASAVVDLAKILSNMGDGAVQKLAEAAARRANASDVE